MLHSIEVEIVYKYEIDYQIWIRFAKMALEKKQTVLTFDEFLSM